MGNMEGFRAIVNPRSIEPIRSSPKINSQIRCSNLVLHGLPSNLLANCCRGLRRTRYNEGPAATP